MHITGVLCARHASAESTTVLATGIGRGLPTEVRLVHAGPDSRFRVDRGQRADLEAFVDWMRDLKASGVKIHTNDAILEYQRSLLRGEKVEWTCVAGFKIFFVSAQGRFWLCSMRPTEQAHPRRDAAGPAREQHGQELPGRLWRLLLRQHVAALRTPAAHGRPRSLDPAAAGDGAPPRSRRRFTPRLAAPPQAA